MIRWLLAGGVVGILFAGVVLAIYTWPWLWLYAAVAAVAAIAGGVVMAIVLAMAIGGDWGW